MNEIDRINKMLPQTQCQRCGYSSCKPYAEAILFNNEDINRCPPGGNELIEKLANHLSLEKKPINPECGVASSPEIFFIDESECIGCGLCLPACPVDAIAGAIKFMHTIIKEECTGCELCVEPCPVDCIKVAKRPLELSWNTQRAENSRIKFEKKQKRNLDDKTHEPAVNSLNELKNKYIKQQIDK